MDPGTIQQIKNYTPQYFDSDGVNLNTARLGTNSINSDRGNYNLRKKVDQKRDYDATLMLCKSRPSENS